MKRIAFLLLLLAATSVYPASYQVRINAPTSGGALSQRFRIWHDAACDSFNVSSFPFDTLIDLDDLYSYKIERLWFFSNDTIMGPDINLAGESLPTRYHATFYGSGVDSVKARPYRNYETAGGTDLVSTFPHDTLYPLTGLDPYKFEFLWFVGPDTDYTDSWIGGSITSSGGGTVDCEGAGGLVWNIIVLDTSSTPDIRVNRARVTCYAVGGMFMGWDVTNGLGEALLAQDADIYDLVVTVRGYGIKTVRDTLALNGQTDTIKVAGWPIMPAQSATTCAVTAYLDGAAGGKVDSVTGFFVPILKGDIEWRVNLVGSEGLTDSSYAFLPREVVASPDSTGRVTFHLMANSCLYPKGSYYEISWKGKGRFSMFGSTYKRFQLDDTDDPVNIARLRSVSP